MSFVRLPWVWVGFLPLCVGGCPLTDDYFIAEVAVSEGGAGSGAAGASAAASGGSAGRDGTSAGAASVGNGHESGASGAEPADGGEAASAGGAPSVSCSPSTERCNGHDDDCDDVVDEQACNSSSAGTVGCSGFVISGSGVHGYMLCTGVTRDYWNAEEACGAQGMRLAWLESEDENEAVSAKVDAIEAGLEAWVGATDQPTEGTWSWGGQGGMFWGGNEYGNPVGNAYAAWAPNTPNNNQENGPQGEDCAVLLALSATWADRACTIKYAYLCEEPEP